MLNKILIVLIFIAVACIGVLFYDLTELIKYKQCQTTPLNQLPDYCKSLDDYPYLQV